MLAAVVVLSLSCALHAADLNSIKTNLEARVGGAWSIESHQQWTFLTPTALPQGLDKGTYCIFVSDNNRTAGDHAKMWMEICQAPFFILGTNQTLNA